MIGMIRPLVQEARKPHKRLAPLGLYMLGTLGSSTFLGLFLGALGSALLPGRWLKPLLLMVALLSLVLAGCDFGIAGARTPTWYRQTCPIWWHTIGHYPAI